MTRIKLIATDVDGTFLNTQRQFNHTRFDQQLTRLAAANIHFVVASGNHLGHLEKVFAPSPRVQTFVAENGSLIVDHGQKLLETAIPATIVTQVVTTILADDTLRPPVLRLSGSHGTYMNRTDEPADTATQDYFFNNLVRVDDLTQVHDTIYKVNGEWPNDSIQHVAKRLNARFPGQINAMASGFGSIDIVAAHMNKAIGLTELAKTWDIAPAEIAAFGDNDNDRDMLAHVGLGVAMQNGTASVKDVANLITPADNNHDGVLDVIDAILADEV